ESEMVHSVFNSRERDADDNPVNDRFKIGKRFHAVPPPYTRNYIEVNNIQMNESEMVHSVFNSRERDADDNPVNDRFKIGKRFHAVPPPYTRNYIPPRPDLSFARLDDFVFKSKVSETITSVPCASKASKDSLEKPKTVRSSAPLIKE
ncbi:hypothetical protein Tco_0182632, partial [Tanacetum coccineum]